MLRRFGVTVLLPGVVLLLFGLRALEQDRSAVDRQIHDRIENAAALAARAIDQQLANWQQFRADGITLAGNLIKLTPEQRSAYRNWGGHGPGSAGPGPCRSGAAGVSRRSR